jgi:hypothetical protein
MIAQFSVAAGAAKGCFRNWQLWPVQFLANLALFGVFSMWLLIPATNTWQIMLDVLVALVLLVSALVLHHPHSIASRRANGCNPFARIRSTAGVCTPISFSNRFASSAAARTPQMALTWIRGGLVPARQDSDFSWREFSST